MTEYRGTMPNTASTFPVTVDSWGWSLQGDTRPDNQDAFLNWAERMLWAVADGVAAGGHGGAASSAIVRDLLRVPAATSLDAHMDNVVAELRRTNATLCALSAAGNFASTVVTLLIHENEAACVWAGDSTCYMRREGVLYKCTKEHTLRQEKIDQGELTAPEAQRMVGGHIITNAVGINEDLRLEQVRFFLRGGDRFLLCSDGLTGLLGPEALVACLGLATAKESAEYIAACIKGMPQPDNITIVVVFLSPSERNA